ncbi:MAG: hypothetical protein E7665_05040 [Ruminococcaceae bacterium]|nr:hypothetical protein [Oscillospiraceae bacterium]
MLFKLIKFELKKLLSGTFLKILLAILLIANIVMCGIYTYDYSRRWALGDGYWTWKENVEELAAEYLQNPKVFIYEIESLEKLAEERAANLGSLTDEEQHKLSYYKAVYRSMARDEIIDANLKETVRYSRAILNNFSPYGDKNQVYNYTYYYYVAQIYEELNEKIEVEPHLVFGWEYFFGYKAEFMLAAVMAIASCVSLVLNDRKSGFFQIGSTCRYGRKTTAAAKFIAMAVFFALISLLFFITTLITVGVLCGYSTPNTPVQTISSLEYVNYNITITGALVISLGMKTLALMILGACVFFVSVLTKSTVLGYASGVVITVISYLSKDLNVLETGQMKFLNLWSVYNFDDFMSTFRSINIGGAVVELGTVLAVIASVCILISFGAALLFYATRNKKAALLGQRRHFITEKLSSFKKAFKHPLEIKKATKESFNVSRYRYLSLTMYELSKHRFMYLALILLFVLKIVTSVNYYNFKEYTADRIYKQYIDQIGGPYTEEKEAFIREEYKRCNEIAAKKDEMDALFWEDKIDHKEYQEFMIEHLTTESQLKALNELSNLCSYFKMMYNEHGVYGSFLYTTGYEAFAQQGVDWILLVFICIFACRMYLSEYTTTASGSSMYTLIQTTEKGRLCLFKNKLFILTVTSIVLWIIFKAIDFTCLLTSYEMPDMSAYLFSMRAYMNSFVHENILTHIIVITLMSLIGTISFTLIFLSLGTMLKKSLLVYSVSAMIIAVPYVIVNLGTEVFGLFDITQLYDTDRLYRLSLDIFSSPLWAFIFIVFLGAGSILLTMFSAKRIRRGTN